MTLKISISKLKSTDKQYIVLTRDHETLGAWDEESFYKDARYPNTMHKIIDKSIKRMLSSAPPSCPPRIDICSPTDIGRKVSIRDLHHIKENITVRYNHDQDCFIIEVK